MRQIVLFTPGLSEPGGARRRSLIYIEGFLERGWDVKVVARSGTLRRFVMKKEGRLRIIEVPGFGSVFVGGLLFLLVAIPCGIFWGMRARSYLAIQFGSQATAACVCGLLTSRPFFIFGSSTGPLSELRLVLSRRTGSVRRRLLQRATALVAQTDDGAAEVLALLPDSRVTVLPNPVRFPDRMPITGTPGVLFTGRLSVEKDLARLLDAWESVARRHPSALLTIAGAGGSFRSVETELRRKVESSPLQDSVRFAGWVADTTPLLASHDIFVFPSLSEGMSNSLLEAVAARRVVVASDIPANRAVLGDAYPLLFAAGDSVQLTKALLLALEDAVIRAQALDAIAERVDLFSADRIVGRVEGMVEDAYRACHQHA